MKNNIMEYYKSIDSLLKNKNISNIDKIIDSHLVKITFYQHERLIHLIVTLAFALFFLLCFLFTVKNPSIGLFILDFLFLLLLIPYIIHYYYLENITQKLYVQYDKLQEKK